MNHSVTNQLVLSIKNQSDDQSFISFTNQFVNNQGNYSRCFLLIAGTFQSAGVIQAAYDLNCPLRINSLMMPDSPSTETSFVEIDAPSVILESLKMVCWCLLKFSIPYHIIHSLIQAHKYTV